MKGHLYLIRPRPMDKQSKPLLSAWTEEFLEAIGWHSFNCEDCGEYKWGPLWMVFCANCDQRSANRHRGLPNGRRPQQVKEIA